MHKIDEANKLDVSILVKDRSGNTRNRHNPKLGLWVLEFPWSMQWVEGQVFDKFLAYLMFFFLSNFCSEEKHCSIYFKPIFRLISGMYVPDPSLMCPFYFVKEEPGLTSASA